MPYLGRRGALAPVTSADIPDNSITAAKIVEGTITVGDIGTDAVGTDEIVNDAVTADKLANSINTEISANTAKVSFTPDAAQVFNDTGADVDFRVEGSGQANALFVQGSDGKVGIGENVPLGYLHVKKGDSGTSTIAGHLDLLFLESSGTAGMTINGSTSSANYIAFGDSASPAIGSIEYHNNGDYMRFLTNGTEAMRIDSSGQASFPQGEIVLGGAGVTGNPYLSMNGAADANFWTNTPDGDSGIGVQGNFRLLTYNVGWNTVLTVANNGTFTGSSSANISDERLKENITTITDALTKINALTGRTFTWKEEADMQPGTHYGLVAQELESVLPDLVYNETGIRVLDKDGNLKRKKELETDEYTKSVHMSGCIPILIEAVKELSAKVTALESA